MANRCCECRAGEHEDYVDDAEMCTVIDPDTKRVYKRGYMCSDHVAMYLEDGYIVK